MTRHCQSRARQRAQGPRPPPPATSRVSAARSPPPTSPSSARRSTSIPLQRWQSSTQTPGPAGNSTSADATQAGQQTGARRSPMPPERTLGVPLEATVRVAAATPGGNVVPIPEPRWARRAAALASHGLRVLRHLLKQVVGHQRLPRAGHAQRVARPPRGRCRPSTRRCRCAAWHTARVSPRLAAGPLPIGIVPGAHAPEHAEVSYIAGNPMRLMSMDSRMKRSVWPFTTRSIARPRCSEVVAHDGASFSTRGNRGRKRTMKDW
jgi:hypothetical protein